MRPILILAALVSVSACEKTEESAGPERRNAAGEVLGGEISDDMLPLESVRSTSPAGLSRTGSADDAAATDAEPDTADATPTPDASVTPRPPFEAAPMPDMTMTADPEPLRTGQ